VKILMALSISEMCVGDVAQILNLNQSTLSHQLKLLRDAKIIDCRREGKIIYYFNINPFINDIMLTGIDNLDNENGDYKFA
ncbi:MAG: metalloregulator ArsR/SmtB family transcription factor, partial [Clostridia bacterium]